MGGDKGGPGEKGFQKNRYTRGQNKGGGWSQGKEMGMAGVGWGVKPDNCT